jgi:hypothetical protein
MCGHPSIFTFCQWAQVEMPGQSPLTSGGFWKLPSSEGHVFASEQGATETDVQEEKCTFVHHFSDLG